MKMLKVMDLSFNFKAVMGGYEGFVLERSWNGPAYLTLKIAKDKPNTNFLVKDNILWFDDEVHKAFIIERVTETLEGNSRMLEVVASSLSSLIRDYITIPPAGSAEQVVTDNREGVVRSYVTSNVISPADSTRAQYPIVLGTDNNYGDTVTVRTRYKNLAEEITSVLNPNNLGWRLDLDFTQNKIVFKVLAGVNRTAGQSTNARVLFGTKYGNLAKFEKVVDTLSSRTVAFVGGQGEGSARTVQKVSTTGATRKREVFVDARNVTDTAELTDKGKQTLYESADITNFTFEVINRQFEYETDWNLGDFVTIVQEDGTTFDRQVLKVQEQYEKGRISVVPEFGEVGLSVGTKFASVDARLSQLETR